MSVKNCPETPRQRMISLMYLVLTAMLALNVDKSVVDAFAVVDKGFMKTIENFSNKNQSVYDHFNNAALENPQKAGELNRIVLQVKERTDTLYNYITRLKEIIVRKADGPKGRIDSIVVKEDLQYAEEVMMTKGNGTLLKTAIEDYRQFIISKIDPKEIAIISSIEKSLDTSNPPGTEGSRPTWESSKFQGYPLIAVITLMSKIQSDIRNSESDLINYYYTKIDASSFKFNKLKALVIPKTDFVLLGDTYEAKVFISAIDTTAVPDIVVGGNRLPIIPGENAGTYRANCGTVGTFVWRGFINFKNPNGVVVQYPFEKEYQVAVPSMTVSPTKMNILYAGLANPVSISVPGFTPRDIIVTMTNGRIETTTSGFLAYPEKVGVQASISVSVKQDKTVKPIGSIPFRVKSVPKPVASVAGKNEGSISKNELLAEQGVFAEIPEFEFDMKFQVLSFMVSTSQGGFMVDKATTGNRFSQEQKDLFGKLTRGSRLYIDNIIVKGDDGVTRSLAPISFKLN
ncbi:MAG: gliding motility protein GldM [Prolixibacteraceae bacterium]